ncbi:ferredoxin reductase [Nocardioides marinquilinus]|uniref:Ferredoxin reductase n=1 Tax=Nocardioides marinquilinus TaxID=1210400 RepID=A0ABP9PU49_9ACTN
MRRTSTPWLRARVASAWLETRTARTLVLDVPGWPGHDAGQHLDVRLTAEDGYQAQRSYSIASASATDRVELTVQKVPRGEVSSYLVDVAREGDELEVRGPVGGWFRWTPDDERAVSLVAGGSGVVPVMAMLRARQQAGSTAPFHLLYSTRTPDHVIYADELYRIATSGTGVEIAYVFTRGGLPDDVRAPGRLTAADVAAVEASIGRPGRVFVCGPNPFVETATRLFLDAGHPASIVRTERFGPTGG